MSLEVLIQIFLSKISSFVSDSSTNTWTGDGESVVQTVSYERTISGSAGHGGGGGAAGEGRGQLHGCEVQPDLVDQGVALADGVDTGGGGEVRGEVGAVLQGPAPAPG